MMVRTANGYRWACWKHKRDHHAGGARPTLEQRGQVIASTPALRDED